jgi:hypothetical protein
MGFGVMWLDGGVAAAGCGCLTASTVADRAKWVSQKDLHASEQQAEVDGGEARVE